jgi:hypothetical protein
MAGIDDIVGALLRDVTNSRVTSDMYSRNISRYYEQDAILRRFPVPRMEIDTLEMDLSFAINNVEVDPLRKEGLESRLVIIFERQSDAMTVDFIDAVVEIIRNKHSHESNDMGAWYELFKYVWSAEYHQSVRARIMRYLDITQRHLIDTKSIFDLSDATKEITKIFLRRWKYLIDDFQAENADIELGMIPTESDLIEAMQLEHRIDSLREEIQQALKDRGGVRVDIIVDSGQLLEIDQSTLCSLKIVTKIKNYNWTKIDEPGEEQAKYILNPE